MQDFLDEIIEASEAEAPGFKARVDEELHRRELARALAGFRRAAKLKQSEVAARMGSTQPEVSKLERGFDVRLSTLIRYLHAVELPAEKASVLAVALANPQDAHPG